MLKSLEKQQAELETELYKVKITINHLKTKVIYVRSPFAQRPVSRFQSPSNRRGNGNEAGTVNTAEASPTSISETSSSEDATLHRRPAAQSDPFTMNLRTRGCRGKESTAKCKAKYEASRERNKFPSPISAVTVPKNTLGKTKLAFSQNEPNVNNVANGGIKNVDVNNDANGGSKNIFLSLFAPTENEEVSSIEGEQENAALDDKNRVNSSHQGQDTDPQQGTLTGQDNLEACGGDVAPQVQARVYAPRLLDPHRLSNERYFRTL